MNKPIKKTIFTFGLFLIYVAAYGGAVSFINHLLRVNGYGSEYATSILIASAVFVYYKCWRWLCRKLDLIKS